MPWMDLPRRTEKPSLQRVLNRTAIAGRYFRAHEFRATSGLLSAGSTGFRRIEIRPEVSCYGAPDVCAFNGIPTAAWRRTEPLRS